MRKNLTKFSLAALALAVLAAGIWAAEKYEEKFAKTEALARDGRVTLINVSGSVEVKVGAVAEVKIEADKIASASSMEKAKANAALVTIEVTRDGNGLKIETKYPSNTRNVNVGVNYRVWVPDKAAVKVRNTSGSVNLEGLGAALEVDVTSGNLTIAKAAGPVDARTVSGRIQVEDVGNDADLKTISGNITASRIKGSVDAETTSGRIELRDISGAKTVRAKVLSGNITYDGDLAPGARITLEALSGSLNLTLPASAAFELNAETFSGSVNSEFAITMSGKISPKELRGTVGAGGASLRLKSFSGGIRIRKK